MNNENITINNMSFYVSIFSGILLTVSEFLPYLTKVKGNGIIQVLVNSYSKYEEDKQKEENEFKKKLDDISNRLEQIEKTLNLK